MDSRRVHSRRGAFRLALAARYSLASITIQSHPRLRWNSSRICLIEPVCTGSISLLNSFESRRLRVAPRKNPKPIKQGLRLFVCIRFQDLFHSPSGVLFAFPSRYWFTIGRSRVFSLGGWSPHLQTGFHVSRPTFRRPSSTLELLRTGLSPSMAGLSRPLR